jgi:malate permease and related proteins
MNEQMILLFSQLGQFLVMLCIGFVVLRFKWLTKEDFTSFSQLLVRLLLPLFLLTTLPAAGTRTDLLVSLPLIALAALAQIILMTLGIISARLTHLPDRTARVHVVCNAITNIGFMGIPIGAAMFGAPGILAASMLTVANDTLMWSVGRAIFTRQINIGFARTDDQETGIKPRFSLKQLINANLIGVFLGCVLLVLEINPAGNLVWDTLAGISSMCFFLPMIIIGGMLATFEFKNLRRFAPTLMIVLTKLLLVPLIFALVLSWLWPGMSDINFKMLIIGIAIPTFSTSVAAATAYGVDAQYAAGCTTVTTLASMITLPLVAYIIGFL